MNCSPSSERDEASDNNASKRQCGTQILARCHCKAEHVQLHTRKQRRQVVLNQVVRRQIFLGLLEAFRYGGSGSVSV